MADQSRTSRFAPATRPVAASTTGTHDPAPAVADPAVPGTVLGGRYRVGDCIGAGAMGVVWSAFDRRLRRTVAVKQLVGAPRGVHDPTAARVARTRALREGRIAARVVHPRAIAVFDVVEHAGATWLVMEYLPSRSLATVLADHGPLEPGVVAHLGAQIADALAAVHDAGIVHGDVKPGNVLIGDDGVAKITDFGVSRASWDTTATGGGTVAGTPGYFAPEVARGDDPTPASDVFSLGATLYAAVENELVCGPLDNTLAVLHAMAEARLRPALRAGVLGRPLAAMLRRDPEHRPGPATVRPALLTRAVPGPVVPAPSAPSVPVARAASPATPATAAPVVADAVDPIALARAATPVAAGPPRVPEPRSGGSGEPAGVRGRGHTPQRDRPTRQRRPAPRTLLVLAASAAVVLGGAGGAAAALAAGEPGGRGGRRTGAAPGPTAPTVAPVAPVAPPTGALAPAEPAEPSADPGPDTPVGDEEATRAVTGYYGSLPADPDRSWATLTGSARDESGGYEGYRRFWDGIRSVRASGLTVDDGSVRADIEFVTADGRTTREPYRFELARDDDGRVVITSASRAADAM